MIYAEILASGIGSRMGNTEMPKQFLILGSKPIFIHTTEQFLLNHEINKIIICVSKKWIPHTKNILKKYIGETDRIDVVEGGNTRNESIINGCKYIEKEYGITKDDIIITHDAVRPFINQRIIKDNIEAAKVSHAVNTVIPATDTIVVSKDGSIISDIPERKQMFQGQTPQTFNLKKLIDLYDRTTSKQKEILTDACKIFVLAKEEVKLVTGELYNIKITTLYDLKIANSIILRRDLNG